MAFLWSGVVHLLAAAATTTTTDIYMFDYDDDDVDPHTPIYIYIHHLTNVRPSENGYARHLSVADTKNTVKVIESDMQHGMPYPKQW